MSTESLIENLTEHLAELEAELHHPGRPCTRERLEQLLHPSFHEVGRSGAPYTRDTVINFLSTRTVIPNVVPQKHQVHVIAEEVALLSFESYETDAAGSRFNEARRSSIWQRTALGWQLVYHQATPVPSLA